MKKIEALIGMPGGELIQKGIHDLSKGLETLESLLVSIGAPRLRRAGLELPSPWDNPEHRLFLELGKRHGNGAHSRYNALIRRLVSLERSLECANRSIGKDSTIL